MRWRLTFALSARALLQQRARSLLAIASCALGVCAVLLLTALGEGARQAVIERIGTLGRNMLIVSLRRDITEVRRLRVALRREDASAIRDGSSAVTLAAAAIDGSRTARWGRALTRINLVGTTPEWRDIREFAVSEGRFFQYEEERSRAQVAVLGAAVRRNLFADTVPPLDQLIRIAGVPFRVIGILEARGLSAAGGSTEDDWVLVPLATAQRRVFNDDDVARIYFAARSDQDVMQAETDARAILRARHGTGLSIDVQQQRVLLDTELAAQQSLRRLSTLLGLLALCVGGVGILSVMLLAVRERRREIGLRIAVGARRADVVRQFLLEALSLAVVGGLIGTVVGTVLVQLLGVSTTWRAEISVRVFVITLACTLLVGVLAGVLPAWRAARLDPAGALRSS